jgi:nucleoside-diphosphate-sugar epimerase
MSRIVVIGGHGKVALHLARILNKRGDVVTSVFRNPAHADDVAATGARPVVADIETLDTDALAQLLAGHDAVVFSAGAGGGNPARTYAVDRDAAIRVIDAARQAGLRRFVMVSYFGAGPDHGVAEDNSFFPYAGQGGRRRPPSGQRPGLDRAGARPPHPRAGDRPDCRGRRKG